MRAAVGVLVSLLVVVCPADAQYFGRNKVEYDRFDFRVARTTHFDIYFAEKDAAAAADAAVLAERWHDRLVEAFGHRLTRRQPLVLYGSHPEFAQTNIVGGFVGEGTGGVTEGLRRRIVMPFGYSLAETDHVLGHEIVHAFQYDMASRYGSSMFVPLWFAEGMAEYLSVGPTAPHTTMMMRDAVAAGRLPSIESLDHERISPYRSGHAVWIWIAERFGGTVIADVLRQRGRASALRRLENSTGLKRDALDREWHEWLKEEFPAEDAQAGAPGAHETFQPVVTRRNGGRVNVAPALSPDGRRIVFLSERDRLSVDLFLADASTGRILRKLMTTAARPEIESLQSLHSAGAWSADGRRFAFAIIRNSRPTLTIFDVAVDDRSRVARRIDVASLGEIAGPTWSPDGGSIAFTGLADGVTDLYVYELGADRLRRLTTDAHADLHPSWSPDGTRLAFATDRFTSDRATLTAGRLELAILDIATGTLRRVPGDGASNRYSPHWMPDGRTIVFATDMNAGQIGRLDLASHELRLVGEVRGSVSGLTIDSPSIAVAREAGAIAISVYRRGAFEIHVADALTASSSARTVNASDAFNAPDAPSAPHLSAPNALQASDYRPRLQLDGIVQPYLATGGSSFGSFVRGGASLSFGDVLGGERLGIAVQAGTRRSDLALQLQYLNRDSRWNWGVVTEVMPYARGRARSLDVEDGSVVVRESARELQFHTRLAGLLSYPFSRSRRVEFSAGIRHIIYEEQLRRREYSAATGRLVGEIDESSRGADPAGFFEGSVAFVSDRAMYGPVGPIAGERWRVEASPAAGELQFMGVLADYRRYLMPVKPYTIAARLMHSARYGRDADDPRLVPLFAGYRHLIRGYDAGAFGGCDLIGDCDRFDALFGSRMMVGNVELRVPIAGAIARELRYGPIPAEAFAFFDAGTAWTRDDIPAFVGGTRRLMRSAGAGVRVNAFGMVVEVGAARPFDRARNGWNVVFNLRPSF